MRERRRLRRGTTQRRDLELVPVGAWREVSVEGGRCQCEDVVACSPTSEVVLVMVDCPADVPNCLGGQRRSPVYRLIREALLDICPEGKLSSLWFLRDSGW